MLYYNCGENQKKEVHGAWEGITGKGPAQMSLRRLPGREAPVQIRAWKQEKIKW